MSSFTGPQAFDVRFKGDRIAYEIGLAEIGLLSWKTNSAQPISLKLGSGFLVGAHPKTLIPGVDCSDNASFLDTTFLGEAAQQPATVKRSVCVFEHNAGIPLRRAQFYNRKEGYFYSGVEDSVLVVRSVLSLAIFDYIIDFVFHQVKLSDCMLCTLIKETLLIIL